MTPLLTRIRTAGMKAGLALKPKTPVEDLLPYLDGCDMVLVMTVEPGFGGQAFMPSMMGKVTALRAARPLLNIQVDGGIGPKNITQVAAAGEGELCWGVGFLSDRVSARYACAGHHCLLGLPSLHLPLARLPAPALSAPGANVIVAGTSVFAEKDPAAAIAALRAAVDDSLAAARTA